MGSLEGPSGPVGTGYGSPKMREHLASPSPLLPLLRLLRRFFHSPLLPSGLIHLLECRRCAGLAGLDLPTRGGHVDFEML